jgi:predicted nucleotidyltransferase
MVSNIPFLDQIVSLIVARADPERIILFGSYARGEQTAKSDIDLLIIKKDLPKGRVGRDILGDLHMDFYYNHIGIAVDLLIVDSERYEVLKDQIGLVYKPINREGKVIFDART